MTLSIWLVYLLKTLVKHTRSFSGSPARSRNFPAIILSIPPALGAHTVTCSLDSKYIGLDKCIFCKHCTNFRFGMTPLRHTLKSSTNKRATFASTDALIKLRARAQNQHTTPTYRWRPCRPERPWPNAIIKSKQTKPDRNRSNQIKPK